jgi:hypothetical protein
VARKGSPDSEPLWSDLPLQPDPAQKKSEPPDWALPSWDSIDGTELEVAAVRAVAPARVDAVPASTEFTLKILGVSEVTRAVRDAVRADASLRDVWVEGEVGRVTVSSAGTAISLSRTNAASWPASSSATIGWRPRSRPEPGCG